MADTLFIPGTVVASSWLNDVNTGTYTQLSGVSGTNLITATGPLSLSTISIGQKFSFLPAATNTGTAGININGLGNQPITKYGANNLVAGDLITGVEALIIYDGSLFQLINPQTFNPAYDVPASQITGSLPFSQVSGTVPIAQGGTGATTAADARNNLEIGPVISFRNKLINALGLINQRAYVSGTPTTGANQYTLDRWRVVTSGQNLTFSTSQNVVTMTAPAGGLEQVIEGSNIETGVYTLSWTGTATATVDGVAITNGGQTASKTGGTNVTIRFSGGTVSKPQFELGSVVTPFEMRMTGLELQLSQRYCIRLNYLASGTSIGSGVFFAATQAQFVLHLPTVMRVAPSVTASSLTFSCLTGGGSINLGAGILTAADPSTLLATFTATVTSTSGFGGLLRTSTASQWIQADAEL